MEKKITHKTRDRRGGHKPNWMELSAGVMICTPKERKFGRRKLTRMARRQSSLVLKQELEMHLLMVEQDAIEMVAGEPWDFDEISALHDWCEYLDQQEENRIDDFDLFNDFDAGDIWDDWEPEYTEICVSISRAFEIPEGESLYDILSAALRRRQEESLPDIVNRYMNGEDI